MPKVVGVKFKKSCRVYYFEACDFTYTDNVPVIVETARGTELGYVCMLPTDMEEDKIVAPLKPIVRLATKKDIEQVEKLEQKREEALKISAQKIAESELDMKLTDCEYTFDGSKLIIYFTADGRVDFRDLVKDLASAFHVRIELRQIGARDECKMLGGLGPCGRVCCCANHMPDYAHVTIKMAKNQGLSLNPTKISGLCGRLMCCLSYENEVYTEINKVLPSIGEYIKATDGKEGVVVALNHLKARVRIKIQDGDKVSFADVELKDIEGKGNAPKPVVEDEEKGNDVPEIFEENTDFVPDEKPTMVEKEEETSVQNENRKDRNRFKKNKKRNHNNNQNNNQNSAQNDGNGDKNKDNKNQKPHKEHRQNDNRNVKGEGENNQPKPNGGDNQNKGDKPFHKRKKKHFHKNNNQGQKPDSSSQA